jgi:hypothetical protein
MLLPCASFIILLCAVDAGSTEERDNLSVGELCGKFDGLGKVPAAPQQGLRGEVKPMAGEYISSASGGSVNSSSDLEEELGKLLGIKELWNPKELEELEKLEELDGRPEKPEELKGSESAQVHGIRAFGGSRKRDRPTPQGKNGKTIEGNKRPRPFQKSASGTIERGGPQQNTNGKGGTFPPLPGISSILGYETPGSFAAGRGDRPTDLFPGISNLFGDEPPGDFEAGGRGRPAEGCRPDISGMGTSAARGLVSLSQIGDKVYPWFTKHWDNDSMLKFWRQLGTPEPSFGEVAWIGSGATDELWPHEFQNSYSLIVGDSMFLATDRSKLSNSLVKALTKNLEPARISGLAKLNLTSEPVIRATGVIGVLDNDTLHFNSFGAPSFLLLRYREGTAKFLRTPRGRVLTTKVRNGDTFALIPAFAERIPMGLFADSLKDLDTRSAASAIHGMLSGLFGDLSFKVPIMKITMPLSGSQRLLNLDYIPISEDSPLMVKRLQLDVLPGLYFQEALLFANTKFQSVFAISSTVECILNVSSKMVSLVDSVATQAIVIPDKQDKEGRMIPVPSGDDDEGRVVIDLEPNDKAFLVIRIAAGKPEIYSYTSGHFDKTMRKNDIVCIIDQDENLEWGDILEDDMKVLDYGEFLATLASRIMRRSPLGLRLLARVGFS